MFGEERDGGLHLRVRWFASQRQSPGQANLSGRDTPCFTSDSVGEAVGLIGGEFVVHQHQRLRSDGGRRADRAVRGERRGVEGFEHRQRHRAAHGDVDAAAIFLAVERHLLAGRSSGRVARVHAHDDLAGLVWRDGNRRTEQLHGQFTAHGEHRIAHRLSFQTADRHAAEQSVVGISDVEFGAAAR